MKKQIKFKVSIAAADWAYAPGQVAEIEKDLAEKWIASGIAEEVMPEEAAPKSATKAADPTPTNQKAAEPHEAGEPKKPVVAPLKSK